MPIGFEKILPTIFSEGIKPAGHLGRTGRVGRMDWVFLGRQREREREREKPGISTTVREQEMGGLRWREGEKWQAATGEIEKALPAGSWKQGIMVANWGLALARR